MISAYIELLRTEWRTLGFSTLCTFFTSPGQTFFIALFLGAISTELGLSATQLGVLYLAATLGAAALLPVTGKWIDHIDLRYYALFVCVGLALACGVMAFASGMVSLFAGFLLLRLVGQGLMGHMGVTTIARYFEKRRGRALSLIALGFPLSEAIMPAAAVFMLSLTSWRMSYAAFGLFILVATLPALLSLAWREPRFRQPPAASLDNPRPSAWDGMRILIVTRFFWLALPAILFMPFSATALMFHIHTIVAAKAWSAQLLAAGLTVYAITHAAGLFFTGELVDRFGARRLLPLLNLPAIAGIGLLGLYDAPLALPGYLGLTGLTAGVAQTTGGALWAEVYGVSKLGTIRSFIVMLVVASTSLGPVTLGAMLDAGFAIAAGCAVLAAIGLTATLLAIAAATSKPAA